MVGSLDQDLPMLPNPERHAGFVVLKAADIPSVLVEMGFMSNPADEAELRRPRHRAQRRRGDEARGRCAILRPPPTWRRLIARKCDGWLAFSSLVGFVEKGHTATP